MDLSEIPQQAGRQHRLEFSPRGVRQRVEFPTGRGPAPSCAAAESDGDGVPGRSVPACCTVPPPWPL